MAAPNRTIADRALGMIANYPDGCSEYILRVHGFTVQFVFELVKDGFATAERRHLYGQPIELANIMITDVGRTVLGRAQNRKVALRPKRRLMGKPHT